MKETKLVEGFKRWPSDAGVTFEGFEEIHLKSREIVKTKLEDFIKYCLDSNKPAIRVLLGEWGEGKTDAFQRYLKPRVEATKNYAFLVSASTLSNAYSPESRSIYELLTSTTLSACKFIAALFHAIKEENHVEKIPDCSLYERAEDYILDCLNALLGSTPRRKIFVFIDEFEELLLEKGAKLKDIISGIKETINGRFEPIDENGQYAGCLHLIIAATPDAYYRLQVTEDTALIFGGLGRRAGVVELPAVRKAEGIEFLLGLLKYAYNNNMPSDPPIEHLGIFHTLYRIAQGNPGNMVSLFTRLFSSAKRNNEIEVVNEEKLLQFLRGEKIFIYGGSASCLETENFDRIVRTLGEQRTEELGESCVKIFKKLIASAKPLSYDHLKTLVRSFTVDNVVSVINNELKNKEKIERCIIKVAPLHDDKTLEDVKKALGEFIKTRRDSEKYIKIDNFACSLEEFEDMITFFDFDHNGKIFAKIFLPTDRNNILHFFVGISEDRSIELENIIKRKKLCKDEKYYLINETLLSQVFPSPVPRELEFLRNREKRMNLWREVTRNLSDYYEKYMPMAFIELLKLSQILDLNIKDITHPENVEVAEIRFRDVKFNAIFYSVNGDVKSDDIEEISRILASLRPIHCVFLLFTGEVTEEAKEKISDKELGLEGENKIIELKLHPTLAKRIISIYIAQRGMSEDISSELLKSVVENTATIDLDLINKMEEWLKSQETKGLAIIDIPLESTSSLREFADTQKFYINFLGEEMFPEEIFNENQKIMKFIKPEAKKVALIPDIEKPTFLRISSDLERNGFLARKNGKLIIKKHPVEEKILDILKREGKVSKEDLPKYFILKSPRYLMDVFIPILEYKGLIQEKAAFYSLTDEFELNKEIEHDYQRFLRICEKDEWKAFGYVLMIKEKGYRYFSLVEFNNLIEVLHREIEQNIGLEKELVLQKLSLLQKLLSHFFEEYYPLIKRSIEEKDNIFSKIRLLRDNFEERVTFVQKECYKWLKIKFDVKDVQELHEIDDLINEVKKYEEISPEELAKIAEEINKDTEKRKAFFFRKIDEEANYFNLKLYFLVEAHNKLEKFVKDKGSILEKIEEFFGALNNIKNQLKGKLSALKPPSELLVATKVIQILEYLIENVLPAEPLCIASITLKEILDITEREKDDLNKGQESLRRCLEEFTKLIDVERVFLTLYQTSNNALAKSKEIFDISESKNLINEFEQKIKEIRKEYEVLSEVDLPRNPEDLLDGIKDLHENIKSFTEVKLRKELDMLRICWESFIQSCVAKLNNMSELLNALRGHVKESEQLNSLINSAREKITIERFEESNLKMSEIYKIIEVIEEDFYEHIKDVLSKDEIFVLEFIITRKKREKWVPTKEIIENVAGKIQQDLKEVLENLVKKGILQDGYTLIF